METERVQANIPKPTHDYFHRHCLIGNRGSQKAIITKVYLALHQACLDENIPEQWDPDNERNILDNILDRLNFRQLDSSSVESGRATGPAPKRKRKPAAKKRK